MHWFLEFIFGIKLCMFQTVPLSFITSFSLYTQQWYMSHRFADSLQATCMTYTTAVHIVKTLDDGERNCPKHVVLFQK